MSLKITYYAATETMGDVDEQYGEQCRSWMADELKKQFPTADVEVLDEESAQTFAISSDDIAEEESATLVCEHLFDNFTRQYFE